VRWSDQVEVATGLPAWNPTETDLLLDLARDVAHGTERRFAPLTAYAVGVAVGSRLGSQADDPAVREQVLRDLVAALSASIDPDPTA
jgi:hypothetical protein